MTDDEAICVAMLRGCEFHPNKDDEKDDRWVLIPSGIVHAVERKNYAQCGRYSFATRGELAHAYCKHYNIGW
jgi:hypothetical protein